MTLRPFDRLTAQGEGRLAIIRRWIFARFGPKPAADDTAAQMAALRKALEKTLDSEDRARKKRGSHG